MASDDGDLKQYQNINYKVTELKSICLWPVFIGNL